MPTQRFSASGSSEVGGYSYGASLVAIRSEARDTIPSHFRQTRGPKSTRGASPPPGSPPLPGMALPERSTI